MVNSKIPLAGEIAPLYLGVGLEFSFKNIPCNDQWNIHHKFIKLLTSSSCIWLLTIGSLSTRTLIGLYTVMQWLDQHHSNTEDYAKQNGTP